MSPAVTVRIDCPGETAVPGFAIQHLVENAIRHGIATSTDGGRVSVAAARDGNVLAITVVDDGSGIRLPAANAAEGQVDAGDEVRGHGLDLTRERLRALYGAGASLGVSRAPGRGTVATLRIPFRTL